MDLMGLMMFCPKNSPEQIRFIRLDLFFSKYFSLRNLFILTNPH